MYEQYRGRCLGRMLHYIHYYCGSSVASNVVLKDKQCLYLGSRVFATVEWRQNQGVDYPWFTFVNPRYNDEQEIYGPDILTQDIARELRAQIARARVVLREAACLLSSNDFESVRCLSNIKRLLRETK